ncbi:MAG: hypothetical protein ACJ786_09545 [Catenulispora sp.]
MPAITSAPVAGRRALRIRVLLTLLALLGSTALAFVPARAAHAFLPDAWGYGYHDPATPGPGPLTASRTSAGSVGQVVSVSGNSYVVVFPGAGAAQGVVHVTAISTTGNPTPQPPSWCEPDKWYSSASNEIVVVSCWALSGGTLVKFPTGFAITYVSATFTGAPGPYFAYAQSDGGSALITQYSSSGVPLSVSHISTGVWTIKLPGVGPGGPALGGDLQVTGQGSSAAPTRCKVGDWINGGGTQLPTVLCFNGATGAPMDSPWSLTYQYQLDLRGRFGNAWGYFWQHSGAPILTNFDVAAGSGSVVSGAVPPAGITVVFPAIGFGATPGTANVTAFGPGPGFCRLGEPAGSKPWINNSGNLQIQSVDCFSGSGVAAPSDFFVSFTSF